MKIFNIVLPFSLSLYLSLLTILVTNYQAMASTPTDTLLETIIVLKNQRQLKGIQLQITKNNQIVFNANLGEANQQHDSIDNNTLFRVASLSKSFTSVALLQLVQQNKINLNQSISELLGYQVVNPSYPQIPITLEMLLTHQSSLVQCQPYYSNFLEATYNAPTGTQIPHLKQILLPGGKFYNPCFFSSQHPPGSYFKYVNLNFGIAGTIIETISQTRFDIYMAEHILKPLSINLPQNATFNPSTIQNANHLAVLYTGNQGQWIPTYDNYNGTIPTRNLTNYVIGTNGVIFGPQGSLRASVTHLNNYMITLANNGITANGIRILSPQSVMELVKPRYNYHGEGGGAFIDFHLYGLGLYTTSYRQSDIVIEHSVTRGHTGSAYGLISAHYFFKDLTFAYIINGALNGYKNIPNSIYSYQRIILNMAIDTFSKQLQQNPTKPHPHHIIK